MISLLPRQKHERKSKVGIAANRYNTMHNFIEKLTVIEELTDTRQQWKVKHKLKDILFIVFAATIANADEWVEMEIFAQHNEQFFKQYIDLHNGIPGHDTIRRVMALINPAIFQNLVNE